MKKIEFETSNGKFILYDNPVLPQSISITSRYIKLSDITEEQASEIVPSFTLGGFPDYNDDSRYFEWPVASLHSLLKSKGVHLFENPVQDRFVCFEGINVETFEYEKAEQKTFYNPYIFKIG